MIQQTHPTQTQAAALDGFGGPEVLKIHTLPVPDMAADEIILRVHTAGVGVWDAMHREGRFVPEGSQFPQVPGAEASGTVVAVGTDVKNVAAGDVVYTYLYARPKGGAYTRYVVTKGEYAAPLPRGLSLEQAGALGADGLTALSGLDTLGLKSGQTLLIFGASGGLGHLALQLAKRQGLKVIAVASGPDGVELTRSLGADLALDGHADDEDLTRKIQGFAPGGVDGLLATSGGDVLKALIPLVKLGGMVAHPNGVQPVPQAEGGAQVRAFNGEVSQQQLGRLNDLIAAGDFEVHIAQRFPLDQAAQAHERLTRHHLGKLALSVESA